MKPDHDFRVIGGAIQQRGVPGGDAPMESASARADWLLASVPCPDQHRISPLVRAKGTGARTVPGQPTAQPMSGKSGTRIEDVDMQVLKRANSFVPDAKE